MDKQQARDCIGMVGHGSVLELPWLERTLLWSIRTWAAYHDAPQSVWWLLERAFTDAGIRPALEPFAQFMSALFAGLRGCPDIRCVRCLRLGKDEAKLLTVLAAVQQESTYNIEPQLCTLMQPAAARIAAGAVLAMMRVLVSGGSCMQQAHDDANSVCWPPSYQAWSTAH